MTSASDVDLRFRLTESQAKELAMRYGTPLYVLDEAHLRARIAEYRDAFAAAYPKTELVYASKANSTLAVLAIAASEGCAIDVASEGEFRAALAACVPAARCHLHGNNKTSAELAFALSAGIGRVVVDHRDEIDTLAQLGGHETDLVLRLAPGVDPVTHEKIAVGQADTKFGFNIADGSAENAVRRCVDLRLKLVGFHCHVGSQLLDPEAQRSGGEIIAEFAVAMQQKYGLDLRVLNLGGGLGVRYTDTDRPMAVVDYCQLVVDAVQPILSRAGLEPTLAQEPGRALVAESGVTLYTVGVRKTVPIVGGERTYLSVNGGLADNPRPGLYSARYTVERVAAGQGHWTYVTDGPGAVAIAPEEGVFTVAGRHCETDVLFRDIRLPANCGPGDLLQVLCTGAYNASMASNYNRYPRPAGVLIRKGGASVRVQRSETWEELLALEILPEGLA